jgi:hypothetical protein
VVSGTDDLLVGIVNRNLATATEEYPAALDQTSPQDRSWYFFWNSSVPSSPDLATADSALQTGDTPYDGNFLIRATGSDLFADGFESSDTSAWAHTQG